MSMTVIFSSVSGSSSPVSWFFPSPGSNCMFCTASSASLAYSVSKSNRAGIYPATSWQAGTLLLYACFGGASARALTSSLRLSTRLFLPSRNSSREIFSSPPVSLGSASSGKGKFELSM